MRAFLTLSTACVFLIVVLVSGQADQQFSNGHHSSSSSLDKFGKNSPRAFESSPGTSYLRYNTKPIWRNAVSDSERASSANLASEHSAAPETDSTGNEQSTAGIANSDTDAGKNLTDIKDSGEGITSSKNQSNALPIAPSPLKTLYIDITKPGLGSPLTQPVFKENAFVGLFNSCSKFQVNKSISEPIGADTCFQDDKYNDRITFEMTFMTSSDLIEDAFHRQPPTLFTPDSVDQMAEPRIFVTDVNKATSTAKVVVLYNCKAGTSGSFYLSLHLSFGDSETSSLSIPWTKTCSAGENDKISFGYIQEKDSTSNKIDFKNSTASTLVIAPSDVSTEVYLKLQQPGAQQAFLAPYVTSSKPEVTEVLVRGNHPSGGVLDGLEETLFQVSYNCERKGSTKIDVSVALPPFDNVTASWIKDCGGQTPSSLQVGTVLGSSDVVKNGEPTHRFMVGIQQIGTEHSDEHLHLSGNQSDWKVFLQNNDLDSQSPQASLHIGRIALTVEHPETVAALEPRIRTKSTLGWSEESNSGFSLAPQNSLEVSFHFVCREVGESRVLITLPILQYETVEFGIAKRCTHVGRVRKSRQLVLTAGKAFASLVAICVAGVVIIVRRRSAAQKGFEALSTTDS